MITLFWSPLMLKRTAKDFHANLFLWTPRTKATVLFIYLLVHSFSLMFWVKKKLGHRKNCQFPRLSHRFFHIVCFCYFCLQKKKKREHLCQPVLEPSPSSVSLTEIRVLSVPFFSGPVETLLPVCGSNNMEARWARVAGWRHCLVRQKSRWQVFKAPQSWGLSLLLLCEAILHLIVLSFPFISLLSAQEKPHKRKRPTQPWVLIWIQCN